MYWIYWILIIYYLVGLGFFIHIHVRNKRNITNDSIRYASLLDTKTLQDSKV